MGWFKRFFESKEELSAEELGLHERLSLLESAMKRFERDLLDFDVRYRRLRATQAKDAQGQGHDAADVANEIKASPGGYSRKEQLRRQFLRTPRRPEDPPEQ